MAYNPALDGLRALSVVAVVLYHAGLLPGGWIGVEVFFVISGYLIARLLLAEHARTGRIDLVAFWRRRARRLLPGIVLLAAVAAVYLLVFRGSRPSTTGWRDLVGLVTYTSNWTQLAGEGYWADFAAPSPLRHAWSLAIEEQFYIAFPLVVALLGRRRVGWGALHAAAAVALAWQVYGGLRFGVERVYLGTDTRAVGLLSGVSLAVATVAPPPARLAAGARAALGAAGLGTLAAASVLLGDATPDTFVGPFQIVVAGSIVVIAAIREPGAAGVLGRWLGSGPLAAVGRWSYGIYLFHWPFLVAVDPDRSLSPWLLGPLALGVAIAVAAVSYCWIEQPIRHRGLAAWAPHPPAWTVAAVGLAAAAGALVVGAVVTVEAPPTVDDVIARPAPTASPVASTAAVAPSSIGGAAGPPTATSPAPTVPPAVVATTTPAGGTAGEPPGTNAPGPGVSGLVPRPEGRQFRLYVVGDSVGDSIDRALQPIAGELGIEVFSRAAGACGYDREPMQYFNQDHQPELCLDVIEQWPADVAAFRPDAVLFAYGAWWGWYRDGRVQTQCEPELAAHVQHLYDLALADLGSTGAPVFFMSPADWSGEHVGPPDIPRYFDCLRAVLAEWAAGADGARVVDLYSMLCVGHDCGSSVDGEPTRPDGVHFEGPAALAVMTALVAAITEPPPGGWPDHGVIDLPG